MNKELLLQWMLRDAEENEHLYEIDPEAEVEPYEILLEDLRNLGGDQVTLPSSLSSTPDGMVSRLRGHFKDNVTLTSRVLNYYFPNQYFFYRVSKWEDEIFRSFEFFSSVIPEFAFSFTRVRRRGFDRYLVVNAALLELFGRVYPDLENPQNRITWFLYQGLGHLFLEKSDYHRYWAMATREEYFASLDSEDDLNWSGRKEMQRGDLVLIYRTAPRGAITDIFEVREEPTFDPWGEWAGFWVDLSRVCRIEDISFATLRDDPVLGNWGVVRKRFNGVVVEPIPHLIYNKLLEQIPDETRALHNLEPEPTAEVGRSGQFESETVFEDQIIEPLLKRWDLNYQRQYRCRFPFGRQYHYGIVDFYVSDDKGPITLFENKVRILDEKALNLAVEQGKSYALMLGLPSFVVASPEGLWIYSLSRNRTKLEKHISTDDLKTEDGQIRSMLLNLRAI